MNDHIHKTPKADILIVDDKAANLRLLSKMLSERDYQVRPVMNGAMALNAARAEAPDLILLDIRMPKMDGYQVCEMIKQDESLREIPVIFISALDELHDKVKAFHVGGVDYVTKPFQFEEVLARVETHLALRDLQRKLQEANQKMEVELILAGEVQAGFLKTKLPQIPGWQISTALLPAKQTSGDFYDVFRLPDGQIGILIADVVDKGVGAALFMALSCTLIRTYAQEYPAQPDQVFSAVNQRLLDDTKSNQFITTFYAIIEPESGEFLYSNAGHCPPYLKSSKNEPKISRLEKAGIPLGIFPNVAWESHHEKLNHGDVLLLYTDGIPDALNGNQEFFGEERLEQLVTQISGLSSLEMEECILSTIKGYTANVPQYDDIALVIVKRI